MQKPLVSIIVPVYKVEKYLPRAVNSVINQTYRNLEIILVDDGSPDRCPKLCDQYAENDSRVKVIHKSNGGLSDARNAALDVFKGVYVTFLDSDDYLSANAIEILVRLAIKENAETVCSGLNIIDSKGIIYDYRNCDTDFYGSGPEMVRLMFSDVFPYNFSPSKLFKRELFENVRYPIGRLYEDIATTYKAVIKSKKVYCTNRCLYYYERGREGNITSELDSAKAAQSYYCGCLNSKEQIEFCRKNSEFADSMPVVSRNLYIWSKLCVESAIGLGRKTYNEYCHKVKSIIDAAEVRLPLRLNIILHFSSLYYTLYPILKRK